MSRTTKEKDIDAVVAEIKAGTTGSVYFSGEEEQKNKAKNLTGGTKQSGQDGNGTKKQDDDDFIERMKAQRAKSGKSSFWKN